MEYIALVVGFLLLLIGLWGLITQKNLIRMVIGFSLFNTGTHIIMVAIAYVKGGTAPILDGNMNLAQAVHRVVDPVPQALVLTAIVIGLGVTALMLAYAMKMHKEKGTLDVSEYKDLKW